MTSEADVTPIAVSRELVRNNSGLARSALVVVGTGHRLADPEPLQAMREACERVARDREYSRAERAPPTPKHP